MDKHYLTSLFAPQSVAVFAGPEGDTDALKSIGSALRAALGRQKYTGRLMFLDIATSGTLADLAQARADLAMIALPLDQVASALSLAARMGCKAALVVGSGINSEEAAKLHQIAQREDMHLLGPNSLGLQRPSIGLNASLAGPLAHAGPMALVSQSGALTSAMLDWARTNAVGFSSVVSLGRHTSVDIAQVLDFLASDPHTHSIVVHLEGICNARRFVSALRSAAHAKPVVVLKAGRRPAGNAAAQTHSGASVGSDDVFDSVLRRAGAVRVRSFVELFSASKCLASRYRPVGRRLAVITNGGGPGVLAADWINEIHLELGVLSQESAALLQPQLPLQASLCDLVDVSEQASAEQFSIALETASRDKQVDGVLVLYSPKVGSDAAAVARAIVEVKRRMNKPLLACWMGDSSVLEARSVLQAASVPNFRTPESAVGAFGNIASFYRNQQLLQQTPPPLTHLAKPDIEGARLVIEGVLAERRNVLTEMESKTLLAAFHIPVTNTILARSATEAMMIATQLGFPVALKIESPDVTHKSDVYGVALNVMNGPTARDTYTEMVQRVSQLMPQAKINGVTVQKMARAQRGREVCIGMVTDDTFGPVITFGAGGTMIELIDDRAMELPPLNQFLARHLVARSRVSETLGAWRGASPVDMIAIEQVLLRVSEMVCELPQLREMDINPLIVDASGAVAVDARIVVGNLAHQSGGGAQYNHLAILPYPARFRQSWQLAGDDYTIRPIRPDDAQMLQDLVQSLSPESRYFRFVSSMVQLPPSMLARFTLIDYDREMALIAISTRRSLDEFGDVVETAQIAGVSRYVINPDQTSCEFALVVADAFSRRGIGTRLMLGIMEAARERGLSQMEGLVLVNNPGMLKLMGSLGFAVQSFAEDADFKLVTHAL